MKTTNVSLRKFRIFLASIFAVLCISFTALESYATQKTDSCNTCSYTEDDEPEEGITRYCQKCGSPSVYYIGSKSEWGYFIFRCDDCGEFSEFLF
mgnify:CR=1 FL=1